MLHFTVNVKGDSCLRKLKRHEDKDVARISKALVDKWKGVVMGKKTQPYVLE